MSRLNLAIVRTGSSNDDDCYYSEVHMIVYHNRSVYRIRFMHTLVLPDFCNIVNCVCFVRIVRNDPNLLFTDKYLLESYRTPVCGI